MVHSLWPISKQQADTLPVVSPSDALRDRGARINLDELVALMPCLWNRVGNLERASEVEKKTWALTGYTYNQAL